jgi:hypothetical protein
MKPVTRLCTLMILAVLGLAACASGGQPTERPDRLEPRYDMNR